MTKGEHNKQLGIPTLEFISDNVTHKRRFMKPGAKHQELPDHFFGESFGLISGGGGNLRVRSGCLTIVFTAFALLFPYNPQFREIEYPSGTPIVCKMYHTYVEVLRGVYVA